ncbi:MAG TPA: putative Ig domain-containing protein [Terriglobales bacterium]
MGSSNETMFISVNPVVIEAGAATVTLSGKLVRKEDNTPVEGADVAVSLKPAFLKTSISGTGKTDASGVFSVNLDAATLRIGSHKWEVKYAGDTDKNLDGASAKSSVEVKEATADETEETTDGVGAIDEKTEGATDNLETAKPAGVTSGTDSTPTFEDLYAPPIEFGSNATVSGGLVKADGKAVSPGTEITVTLIYESRTIKSHGTTNEWGKFRAILDTSNLPAGSYTYSVKDSSTGVTAPPGTLIVYAVPSTEPCNPCTDLVTAAKRVLRDPKVNQGIGDWLLATASGDKKGSEKAGTMALTTFANAVSGRDAVPAKSQPCRGRLRLYFEFLDLLSAEQTLEQAIAAVQKRLDGSSAGERPALAADGGQSGDRSTSASLANVRLTQLNQEILKTIKFQLLDDQLRIAGEGGRTYDAQGGILISGVEVGTVFLSLLADIFGGAEILDDFLATDPGGYTYRHYTRTPVSIGPAATTSSVTPLVLPGLQGTAYVKEDYSETLTATGGTKPYTYTKSGNLPSNLTFQGGQAIAVISGSVEDGSQDQFTFTVTVTDSSTPQQTASAVCSITCRTRPAPQSESVSASTASPASTAIPDQVQRTTSGANLVPGYRFKIGMGETRGILFLRPPVAHVRCFTSMEGDDCCGQGKQYVSRVWITAMQGDNPVRCMPTSQSGCAGFNLNPGWYQFSAPREITIQGCNYTLATSSPISAFLGADQSCSDIYFSYKKKGNEIEVISKIISALGGDPYVQAKENFPGMQYLILSGSDPSFVPQQLTTTDGSALCFRNLAAGPYHLFCQAPPLYGAQPVAPVYPPDGHLALQVFGGQTSRIPIPVKFRTTTTAPAVLNGYVRDDTGAAVPGQVVKVLNSAGCLVAAGLTDTNGFYSIQIYFADDLTLMVGAQQIAVSKAQIQAAMKAVGTPPLPSPATTMELAMQSSELVPGNI